MSGAERQAKYRKNNKEKSELNEAKRQFERMKTLNSDTDKAKEIREAAKIRKQNQRSRERIAKLAENKENEASDADEASENVNVSANEGPFRQRVFGEKQKRKNNRDTSINIKDLTEENAELRKALDKNDDQLAEMDFKLSEAQIKVDELTANVKHLEDSKEKEAFENDDWIKKGLHEYVLRR